MPSNPPIHTLISDYLKELGLLLSLRISAYHQKHKSAVDFVNSLIVCPVSDEFYSDYLDQPALARQHFEENVSAEVIAYFALRSVYLTPQKQVAYILAIIPEIFPEQCGDVFEIVLVGTT